MADTLTIVDNRTGKKYELPIQDGTIRAMDLRQIKTGPDDFGLMTYDPAFMNTANCRSAITYIDGDKGILLYRGYPIEQLAEDSDYLETAYLILFGELPTASQQQTWTRDITLHTMLHENIKKFMEGFRYDAHPMGIFLSTVGALSTFYPDAKNIFDKKSRLLQTQRLIAKVPSIAAYAYRHSIGRPYVYPDNDLSFTGNFLNMLFKMTELKYQPNPVLARALDVLFILHADHEQNCSTTTMRTIGSSHVDPYSALAGAAAALYGPLHGGANEAVLRMLDEIGSVAKVPEFIKRVKSGEGTPADGLRPPRLQVVRSARQGHQADRRPRVRRHRQESAARDRARARAHRAAGRLLRHPQAVSERRFLLGLIYQAMGFPVEMFPVLFAIPRTAGWIAQWEEMLLDPEQKIARPRQIYTGPASARLRAPTRETSMRFCDHSGSPRSRRRRRWQFDSGRAWEHLRQMVAIGPRPAGSPAIEETRKYIKEQLAAGGRRGHRTGVGRPDAARQDAHGEPHRDDSRREKGPHRHRRPLRHEDLSRVPVRRRERRRIERGVSRRAGARAEGAQEPADDRAAVPGRRRSRGRVGGQRPHVRQPPLRRGRQARRHARERSRRSSSST